MSSNSRGKALKKSRTVCWKNQDKNQLKSQDKNQKSKISRKPFFSSALPLVPVFIFKLFYYMLFTRELRIL